jgi:hypothetical protein
MFATGTGTAVNGVNVGYTIQATPITINQTGIRGFCVRKTLSFVSTRRESARTPKRAS